MSELPPIKLRIDDSEAAHVLHQYRGRVESTMEHLGESIESTDTDLNRLLDRKIFLDTRIKVLKGELKRAFESMTDYEIKITKRIATMRAELEELDEDNVMGIAMIQQDIDILRETLANVKKGYEEASIDIRQEIMKRREEINDLKERLKSDFDAQWCKYQDLMKKSRFNAFIHYMEIRRFIKKAHQAMLVKKREAEGMLRELNARFTAFISRAKTITTRTYSLFQQVLGYYDIQILGPITRTWTQAFFSIIEQFTAIASAYFAAGTVDPMMYFAAAMTAASTYVMIQQAYKTQDEMQKMRRALAVARKSQITVSL